MNRVLMQVLAAGMVLLLSSCTGARANAIEVHEAWMRPAAQGANGAVYFVIQNRTSQADEIVGVASEVARAAETHESLMSADVMQMRRLESVPLGPGEELVFQPGGLHVMLIDLRQDLKEGDEIRITLQFSNSPALEVMVPVRNMPGEENH